jgi:hypothetical protein
MWYRMTLIGVLVGGGIAVAEETKQEQPAPAKSAAGEKAGAAAGEKAGAAAGEKAGAIDPKADAALHRMSDYLSNLKSFRVETTTVDETKVDKDGQKIQELAESKIAIRRPGELRIDRTGANGRVMIRDDGKQLSIYDQQKNSYTTTQAPAKLDQAADTVREQLQVDSPGVDLLATNPYEALTEGATEARYIGLEPMAGGKMAHHLAVTKKDVHYQIWIQDGAQPLPLRYVVTGKDMRGSPQFSIELHNWQPNATVPANGFQFTPPAGAKKMASTPPRKG